MERKLERLIQLLHKRRFAEKIGAARTWQKARKIYKRERKRIAKQINSFAKEAHKIFQEGEEEGFRFIVDKSFKVETKDAVEIGWISFMIRMREDDLLQNYNCLIEALNCVTGVKAKTAREMSMILEQIYLTSYTLEDLLEKFI
jgi:chorismate mutase